MNEKRKKIEALVYKVFDQLDKTKANTKKYKDFFNKMTDKEFDTWAKKFLEGDDNLQLEILPWKNEPSMDDIQGCAKSIGLPLEEYVYFRHEGEADENGVKKIVRSRSKCCVGYISVRRLQQILSKKNSYTTDISKRNSILNTVTGDSQKARSGDAETNALVTLGCDVSNKELLGFRADDANTKALAYQMISRDGFVKMSQLQQVEDVASKSTLNTLSVYLTGAGLENDLLGDDLLLYATKIGINFKE
jgi:hypothetical protein